MKYKLLIAALVAAFGLVACNDSSTSKPASDAPAVNESASQTPASQTPATVKPAATATESFSANDSKTKLPQSCEDYFKMVDEYLSKLGGHDRELNELMISQANDLREMLEMLPSDMRDSTCKQTSAVSKQGIAGFNK